MARNFNVPYIYGNIDLRNFKPHRKNPHIANVFSQTIMVEELGSGTKRIFKYTPLYANGQMPEIYEDDYFTIVIPTPFAISDTNHGTINRGSDTINGSNDTNKGTINGTSDTINSGDDTINGASDTINGVSDTINGASDTNNDTINSQNVTINSGSDTINGDSDTINGDSDTIKLTVPDLIIQELRKNPYMTATELGKIIGINRRNTATYIRKLIDAGRIIRVGAKKNGHRLQNPETLAAVTVAVSKSETFKPKRI